MKHSKKHPGFAAVEKQMAARQGISEDRAAAELASAGRNASLAAKRKNPRLMRIKGARK